MRALLLAAVIALAAAGSTAAAPALVIDRTLTCTLPVVGGAAGFELLASPRAGVGTAHPLAALLMLRSLTSFSTTPIVTLAYWSSAGGGVVLDQKTLCKTAPRIALAATGLPSAGTFPQTRLGGSTTTTAVQPPALDVRCLYAPKVAVRLHVVVQHGDAVSAQLLVASAVGKRRPIVSVAWTPALVRAHATDDCSPQ